MIKPLCPRCDLPLTRQMNNFVFRYSCNSCLGFSVTTGGLSKVLSSQEIKLLLQGSKIEINGCPCPMCQQPMRNMFMSDYGVELDLCNQCKVVWLDTGEWNDLQKKNNQLSKSTQKRDSNNSLNYARMILALEKEKTKSVPFTESIVPNSSLGPIDSVLTLLGLPVKEDKNSFIVLPWVTWALILICSLVSIWGFSHQIVATETFGFSEKQNFSEKIITIFSSFFIHGNVLHLLSNMYFLWLFGDNVEDHLGKKKYIFLITISTAVGNILYGAFDPLQVPAIGASGGLSGVIAYYICRFPHRRFIFSFNYGMLKYAIPGVFIGLLFLVKELLGSLAETSGVSDGVAHLAHLGGALVGIIFAIIYAPPKQDFLDKE